MTSWAHAEDRAVIVERQLPVRQPFDAAGVLRWLAGRAVPEMELAGEDRYSRVVRLPGGPAWFEVRLHDAPHHVSLRAQLTDPADEDTLVRRVRRLLDLDIDPVAVEAALSKHPQIAALVAKTPGIRVPGSMDPQEMLMRAMIGQQISVARARTLLTQLVHALGERFETSEAGTFRLFPTMAAVTERSHEVLRGPGARIRAIASAAAELASGTLRLGMDDDSEEMRTKLLARPGVGPWTADYVRMRVLGDPDILLTGDSALRSGARLMGVPDQPRELEAWAARTSPWRSYLTAHLWRAAGGADKPSARA